MTNSESPLLTLECLDCETRVELRAGFSGELTCPTCGGASFRSGPFVETKGEH